MQQRYYDPMIGRFLSVDPVTATSVGGNFNRYWYGNDNPYRFKDLDGRQSCLNSYCDTGAKSDQSGGTDQAQEQSQKEAGKSVEKHFDPIVVVAKRDTDAATRAAGAAASGGQVARKSSSTLRRLWEKFYNRTWPKDPNNSARNQDVAHKQAVGDGGDPNDPQNYDPQPHDEHMRDHMERGDFKRWGARSVQGGSTPDAPVTAPDVAPSPGPMAPEVPEIPIEIPLP